MTFIAFVDDVFGLKHFRIFCSYNRGCFLCPEGIDWPNLCQPKTVVMTRTLHIAFCQFQRRVSFGCFGWIRDTSINPERNCLSCSKRLTDGLDISFLKSGPFGPSGKSGWALLSYRRSLDPWHHERAVYGFSPASSTCHGTIRK